MAMTLPILPAYTFAGAVYDWTGRLIRDRATLPLRWTPLNAAAEEASAGASDFRVLLDVEDGLAGRLLRPPRVIVFVDLPLADAGRYTAHVTDGFNPEQEPDLDTIWGLESGVLAEYLATYTTWLRERGILVLWYRIRQLSVFDCLPIQLDDRNSFVPPEQYLGGEVIYLSAESLLFWTNYTDAVSIHDAPVGPPNLDIPVVPPPGTPGTDPKYLVVEPIVDVLFDEVNIAQFEVDFPLHEERFHRLEYILNLPTTPQVWYLPEGYTPATYIRDETTVADAVRARMEQLATDTGTTFLEDMTAADIHTRVQAFFGS